MDDFDGLITVELHHGGKFMGENAYFMGSTIVESEYDFESLTFEELEIVMKANGHHSVLKYAARKVGDIEEYAFFHDKKSFEECINSHVDWGRKCLKLYFECLSDDLTENLNGDGYGDTNKDEDGGWNFDKDGDVPLVDESGSSEDGMEDGDFVSDDEEVVEARKIKEKNKVDKKAYQKSNLMKEVGSCSTNLEVEAIDLHSEYDDSDASMNSDNGLNKVRKMTKGKLYSSNCDHNTLIFEIGMRFRDCKECKEAVAEWTILNGHDITWKKSGGGKLEARCVTGCPWKLYASKLATKPTCIIKTLSGEHNCVRATTNRQVTSEWLSKKLLPALKRYPNYKGKDMVADVKVTFGVSVNMMMCYRSKWKALKMIRGSYESHYSKLRSYLAQLQLSDKVGTFLVKTFLDENDHPVFQRCYIGFSALKNGFMVGCRRCIGFDACFLKTVLGGAILAAVAKDCNNKMYPIAWVVVEKENEATWSWFFEKLFEDLGIIDGNGWTFMSDKHKRLIKGIQQLAPHGEHIHCARHIYANWKKKFSGPKFKGLFWNAVKSCNQTLFEESMDVLKEVSVEAYDEFTVRNPKSFCKSLVSLQTKTDIVDNNICETFNSYILGSRDKAIIDMLEDIRQSLMVRMHDIVKSLKKNNDVLCPNVRKKLNKIQRMSNLCIVKPAVQDKYEVIFDERKCVVDHLEDHQK